MAKYGQLIIVGPDGSELVLPLTASEITLGREEDNDIVLADPKVSRLHARLVCSKKGCDLIDAGSANGTFVDGQRIECVPLRSGNLITLGSSTLRFEAASPSRRAKRSKGRSTDRQLLHQFLDEIAQPSDETEPVKQDVSVRDQLLRVPRLVIHTPTATWEHRLQNQDRWTLGRSEDNDIVIDHQKVSRYHAHIERDGESFIIRDLESANGTFLGQQRIDRHTLSHTDTVNIGHAQLVFKDVSHIDPTMVAPKTERVPVIVVPGNFGSDLWRGTEKIWPNVRTLLTHPEKFEFSPDNSVEARSILSEVAVVPKLIEIESYVRIGDHLQETMGYIRGHDLLEFAYDWRDDIRKVAHQLAEAVAQWHPATPPVIIAHSMGCLVSRYYVDCLGGAGKIKKLLLMGGPNHGFPAALLMILPDNLSRFHTIAAALSSSLGKNMMHMFASFPSLYQMLPFSSTVSDHHDQPLDLYEDSNWLPPNRQGLLAAGADFVQALNKEATIPTTCIFGYGTTTVTRLCIERNRQGLWKNVEMITTSDGDSFIPSQSAILPGADIHPIQHSHNQLYVNEDVLMRLRYELTGQGK
ncbi:MAG: FHA domain-containing protein [Anaerolineae bacterium]|nr:FHA domain-containing protein [Anaerolineae bacterium]